MANSIMKSAAFGLGFALVSTPAIAARANNYEVVAPQDDSNSYWLDYKTDISEAKRELAHDLRRSHDESDRERAWSEYRRELADARSDYRKEMLEKGYRIGTVTVEDAE